jgi:hypothetical protein
MNGRMLPCVESVSVWSLERRQQEGRATRTGYGPKRLLRLSRERLGRSAAAVLPPFDGTGGFRRGKRGSSVSLTGLEIE